MSLSLFLAFSNGNSFCNQAQSCSAVKTAQLSCLHLITVLRELLRKNTKKLSRPTVFNIEFRSPADGTPGEFRHKVYSISLLDPVLTKDHESAVRLAGFCDGFCWNPVFVSKFVLPGDPSDISYVLKWKFGLLSRANLFSCWNWTTFVFTSYHSSARTSAKKYEET